MFECSSKKLVVQSNELVEASYSLNLNGKRLLLLAISKIDPSKMPAESSPLSFVISAKEFLEAYPNTKNAYRDLKRGAEELTTKTVTFRSNNRNKKTINLTDSVEYIEAEAKLVVTFGYSASHHLMGLISEFTKFDLLAIRKLNSIYSVRLFELLSQYRSTGFRLETLDNIRFSLNVNYKKYTDLNRFVIKKAVEELNNKSSFTITYEPYFAGNSRSVTSVRFCFKEDTQADLFR